MAPLILPRTEELTLQQQKILKVKKPIIIYGGAGTGKTLVSTWRHILNYREKRKKSYLITFTHTLTYFLEKFAEFEADSEILGYAKKIDNKDRFLENLKNSDFSEISEIIIDEAQDISLETHKKLKEKFQISCGADDDQILYPGNSTTKNELETLYPENVKFTLIQNFRNSYEILQLTNSVFPNCISEEILDYAKTNFRTGIIPKLIIEKDELKRQKRIVETIKEIIPKNKTIGILVPTQNYTSASIDNLKKILKDNNIDFSSYDNRDNPRSLEVPQIRKDGIQRIHLTTFKSSKGLEFDSVIIPNFEEMDFWSKKGNIITKNDYYVGFTRAKNRLFLISEFNNIEHSSDFYEID